MSDLCNAVKILAQEAINSQKPLEAVFGKVINESPLKIETEQRLILTKDFITVAEHLRERTINVHIGQKTSNVIWWWNVHFINVKVTQKVKYLQN